MKVACIFFTFILSYFYSNGQEIFLAKNGHSEYQIVIPEKATQVEKIASNELQKYLRQITGTFIPVVSEFKLRRKKEILVGNVRGYRVSVDHEDGILIKTAKDKLIISGGRRKGVLYSVYTFLEEFLGCRRYTKEVSFIPSNRNLSIANDIDLSRNPAFDYRNALFEDDIDKTFADWHKMNYFFEDRMYPAHSLSWFLPAEKYFVQHPEYYALINGKRNPAQVCFSNPDVFKVVKGVLQHEINARPNNKVWSVSHPDYPFSCSCNLCKPKHDNGNGFIETLLPFVNKMADAFPDKIISTLAYNQSMLPSKTLKPRKNVEIMFCFTNTNRMQPLKTANDPQSVACRSALAKWQQQTANIFIWDYAANYFHSMSPFPNWSTYQDNIQFFRSLSIKQVFEQGTGRQKSEFSELRSYLLAKLLWNPELDVDNTINEFLNAYYGPASGYLKKYLDLISKFARAGSSAVPITEYSSPLAARQTYLSNQHLRDYNQIFDSAERAVKDNRTFLNRVKKERLALSYAEIEIGKENLKRQKNITSTAALQNKVASFSANAKLLGVSFLSFGERSPDQYKMQTFSEINSK
ncbi:DUF4838 domain-containing protein [Niabella insulamsoli]|uniref:DUF4838 domain-containing protein n=1 Tax=Niabella insulamsoli TaxID=3144874 RepID=UPI0031FD17A1